MKSLLNAVEGKKSYIVALAMIAYAVISVYLGKMSHDEAMQFVLNGLGLAALRNGIAKIG